MKIRTGFVSNSSSTSFTCDICGGIESGYDESPSDLGLIQCENDHLYHQSCCKDYFKDCEEHLKEIDVYGDGYKEERVDENFCPICTLKSIEKGTLLRYVLYINNKTEKEIGKEIRARFTNLKELDKKINKSS